MMEGYTHTFTEREIRWELLSARTAAKKCMELLNNERDPYWRGILQRQLDTHLDEYNWFKQELELIEFLR